MKTKTTNLKLNHKRVIYVMIVFTLFLSGAMTAQESDSTRTLLNSEIRVSEIWTPEVKFNSIQGDIGTLVGMYGGLLINRTFLAGISGGVNLGHPRVNYGYFGGIGQYIWNPAKVVHFSAQFLVAFGTTKDYEQPKSGPFDNFWNISGARFFLMEPGINLELNLSDGLTLVTGLSYRFVTGLNESDVNIALTHVSNRDLSGLNFNIGMKFGKEKR